MLICYLILAGLGLKNAYNLENPSQAKFYQFVEKTVPYPAATVGKNIISLSRLKADIYIVKNFINISKTADRYQNIKIQEVIYNRLIESTIVEKIAEENKIKVSQEDVEQAWNAILFEQEAVGDVQQILKDLHGTNENHLKKFIRETLIREKVESLPKKRNAYQIQINFTKDDQKSKDQALEKIQELKKQLDSGGNFEEIAKSQSQDTITKDNGGSLGWVDVAFQFHGLDEPKFKDQTFNTEINKVSDPVESSFGFHLVKSTEEKGSINKSMNQLINDTKLKVKIIRFLKFN